MRYNKLHYILFSSILTFGILAIVPSASANTSLIIIMPGGGTSNNCSYSETCFSPSILSISPGDTVTWANGDNVVHSTVSGLPYVKPAGTIFDSGTIAPGKTFSFTFYNPGTYKYFDLVDRWMVGEVIVVSTQQSPTVPEFGSTAGLIVIVSITGVIAISRTFMKI